jgi:hypothetical protein
MTLLTYATTVTGLRRRRRRVFLILVTGFGAGFGCLRDLPGRRFRLDCAASKTCWLLLLLAASFRVSWLAYLKIKGSLVVMALKPSTSPLCHRVCSIAHL